MGSVIVTSLAFCGFFFNVFFFFYADMLQNSSYASYTVTDVFFITIIQYRYRTITFYNNITIITQCSDRIDYNL